MKKIILSILCIAFCFIMVGCSSADESQALKNLDNQLNRISNIVSSTSSSEVSEVSPLPLQGYEYSQAQLPRFRATAYENMIKEEELRQEILYLNSYLKSSQDKQYKLGKQKTESLNELTSNISKYVTYLNNTKSEVKNSVNKIKRNTKPQALNIEQAKSGYTSLNNSMNERFAYLNNLYSSMNEVANILNDSIVNNDQNQIQNYSETPAENYQKNENYYRSNPYVNNQSNYSINNKNKILSDNKNEETNNNLKKNIDTYRSNINNTTIDPIYNQANYYNYRYNNLPYNGYYPNNYNYYRNNTFNPNRNTDTFYPYMRNIDTYRELPSYTNNNGINNIQNLYETNYEKEESNKENLLIETNSEQNTTETIPSTNTSNNCVTNAC